jgi:hypothetical protein
MPPVTAEQIADARVALARFFEAESVQTVETAQTLNDIAQDAGNRADNDGVLVRLAELAQDSHREVGCQGPSGSPGGRSGDVLAGGHQMSWLVAL